MFKINHFKENTYNFTFTNNAKSIQVKANSMKEAYKKLPSSINAMDIRSCVPGSSKRMTYNKYKNLFRIKSSI